MSTEPRDREKQAAALNSVGAAAFLTGLKIVDGVLSGSIGILTAVRDCHAVCVRHSGPHDLVDLHVTLDSNQSLQTAHVLMGRIEQVAQGIPPGADATVNPEPTGASESKSVRRTRTAAESDSTPS